MQDVHGDDGEFIYFGIRKGLERCVDPETHTGENVELVLMWMVCPKPNLVLNRYG